ncbi:hypothetical protein FRB94_000822 [Tulasnella sp. JGI-2019a]|nr:hypothetical protein FRB94_000822 [Tulasnella sp. JGI-2019a]
MLANRLTSVASRKLSTSTRAPARGLESLLQKSPDDVVLTLAIRTPMCKARKGGFKDTTSDALLLAMLRAVKQRCAFDVARVQDIAVGTCHPPSPVYEARAAALAAGFPQETPVQAINRLCSSGLMAIRSISDSIARGDIDVGLAVGYESMTKNPRPTPTFGSQEIKDHQVARDCAEPMGWTSEMLAQDFNIKRQQMDEVALMSHTRAFDAQKAGRFVEEIIPVEATFIDEEGNASTVLVDKDDELRPSTLEGLAKIKPAFPQWGNGLSTAGNSSQMTDGAAAVMLMRRNVAEELGLPILAKHVATSVVGVSPRVMGVGPVPAIRHILEKTGLTTGDVDLYEINEAYASQVVYCLDQLQLPLEKVNVNGGAIAFGHPLGATGARQVVTGMSELRKRDGSILCTSMCIGSGMGAAAIFVNENAQRLRG